VDSSDSESADWCLQVAAAMEQSSAHPLASAILDAAKEKNLSSLHAEEISHVAGEGVEARINGMLFRLGRADFVAKLTGFPIALHADPSVTSVYLGTSTGLLARFELADSVRSDAASVVRQFKAMGKQLVLLSGDQAAVSEHIAAQLGIPLAYGECLPEQKLAFVQKLQAEGAVVAMVGDGINDAAVLRAADVSFAMGGGAALAQTHADAVLLSGRLSSVAEVAMVATKTMQVIRQNLAWSTVYNVIAIPAAALGLINPWLSGVGMSVSSAVVILNALRLSRVRTTGRAENTQAAALRESAA
jgi:P-type Cu2+ transporter